MVKTNSGITNTPPQPQSKQRDTSLDVFKFFLICGVVIDHVMMMFNHGRVATSIYVFFYTFNIPMFVLMVGYFSKIGNKTEKYVVSTFDVLALFLVFNVVMGLCYPRPLSLNAVLTPQTGAWFLLSLFVWRFVMMYMKPEWINPKGLLVCIAISILAGLCPLGDWFAFMRTFDMFPFLFLGLLFKGTNVFERLRGISRVFPFIVVLVCFCLIYLYHPYQNYIFSGFRGLNVLSHIERLCFTLAAVVLGLSVYRLLPHNNNHFLAKLGQKTLFIYVYHLIILRIMVAFVNHYDLPTSLPYLSIYIIAIVVMCCLLSNIHFLDRLTKQTWLSEVSKSIHKNYILKR
ncbi:MAG: acyltransferase family protein [Prevotella sp.]